jgi:flagellar assembly protein FliH
VIVNSRVLKRIEREDADTAEPAHWLSPSTREAVLQRLTGEAAGRVERVLLDAQADATAIINEAHGSVDAERSQARAQGFEAGYAAGMKLAEQAAETLRKAALDAAQFREALVRASESELVSLALAIAEQVVGAAARDHTAVAVDAVAAALADALAGVLQIRVNPADAQPVRVSLPGAIDRRTVVEDDGIAVGDCIVHLAEGIVDMRIDTRMASVRAALRRGQ